jgi:hypothetical protein
MDMLRDQHSILGSWSDTFTANSSTALHRRPQHRRHASHVSPAAAIPSDHRPHGTVDDARQHSRARGTSPHSVVSDVLPDSRYSPRTNAHMKRLSMLSKPFSFSNISSSQSTSDERERPASSPSAAPPSRPLLRTETSPLPRLSPTLKRKPPASHSSYGIDTSTGPPPSYSTLSQERLRPQERVVHPSVTVGGKSSGSSIPLSSSNTTANNSTGSKQPSERPVSTSKRNLDLGPDSDPTTTRSDKSKRASGHTRSGSLARSTSDTTVPTVYSQTRSTDHTKFQKPVPTLQNRGFPTAQPESNPHTTR